MEKDSGSEWSAQVTKLPAGSDSKILEKRESKRTKGKGDHREGAGGKGAVRDAFHLISS